MNMRYALKSEDTEQINVFSWAEWNRQRYPALKLLHHIPNGGSRNKAEAVKLKQMGVRAGVPDLHLPVPRGVYCGLYIEMKYDRGRVERSQKEFLQAAAEAGNFCVVCYGADMAIRVLEEYMQLQKIDTGSGESRMSLPNGSILKEGRVKKL